MVSCVTVEAPYRVHPHRLTSKLEGVEPFITKQPSNKEEGCIDGVYIAHIDNEDMSKTFPNLVIMRTEKKEVRDVLSALESTGVDPFRRES